MTSNWNEGRGLPPTYSINPPSPVVYTVDVVELHGPGVFDTSARDAVVEAGTGKPVPDTGCEVDNEQQQQDAPHTEPQRSTRLKVLLLLVYRIQPAH